MNDFEDVNKLWEQGIANGSGDVYEEAKLLTRYTLMPRSPVTHMTTGGTSYVPVTACAHMCVLS